MKPELVNFRLPTAGQNSVAVDTNHVNVGTGVDHTISEIADMVVQSGGLQRRNSWSPPSHPDTLDSAENVNTISAPGIRD